MRGTAAWSRGSRLLLELVHLRQELLKGQQGLLPQQATQGRLVASGAVVGLPAGLALCQVAVEVKN